MSRWRSATTRTVRRSSTKYGSAVRVGLRCGQEGSPQISIQFVSSSRNSWKSSPEEALEWRVEHLEKNRENQNNKCNSHPKRRA